MKWSAAIVVVSVCAALGVSEGVLRARGLYRPPDTPITTARPDLYRADPNVGYTLWPAKTTTYRYPQASDVLIPLVSNADGFRASREFGDRDGRVRVLVVGDSFVFGQGVRAEERVTEQLEALEPQWRVDNMGMTGWGIDLMIRAIAHHGPKADPDIVVLAVYTDDFRRLLPYYAGVGVEYQKFALEGASLTSVPFPRPAAWERLRLVQLVYQTRWQRDRNQYALHTALLDRYLELAESVGFKPAVTFFPGLGDTAEDRQRRGFLAEWTARHGVPYADLTDAIHGAGVDQVYIQDNWHWNPSGHRIAARELQDLVRERLGRS